MTTKGVQKKTLSAETVLYVNFSPDPRPCAMCQRLPRAALATMSFRLPTISEFNSFNTTNFVLEAAYFGEVLLTKTQIPHCPRSRPAV